MFSEVLKIVPKLDNKDLDAMQKSLSGRFAKMAKGFGKGLITTLKGGGIAGIALDLVDKLLNPLKEVQAAIDKSLATSDDLAVNAKQFNASTGELAKLTALAKASGLDQGNLFFLMTKFQTAVAQAKADPTDQSVSSVRNYAGQKDIAVSFFSFISELQKLSKDQQVLVQSQIFGERQTHKMAEFLGANFDEKAKITGIDKVNTQSASEKINKLAELNQLQESLGAAREFKDMLNKSGVINEGMVRARDKSEQIALDKENQRIKSYTDLAAISDTVDKLSILVDEGVAMLGKLVGAIPAIQKMSAVAESLIKNSWITKGIKLFGGKEGE